MAKTIIGYVVNDREAFKRDVLDKAIASMFNSEPEAPHAVYAVSNHDEFQKVEDIEEIVHDDDKYDSDSEKLEAIREVLKRG